MQGKEEILEHLEHPKPHATFLKPVEHPNANPTEPDAQLARSCIPARRSIWRSNRPALRVSLARAKVFGWV